LKTYQRGDRIPEHLRDHRFYTKEGTESSYAMKKWWLLRNDGSPEPNSKPYPAVWQIEWHHRSDPSLGEFQILKGEVGRPSVAINNELRSQIDQARQIGREQIENEPCAIKAWYQIDSQKICIEFRDGILICLPLQFFE
jgi:hypothetical protein